MGVAYRLAVNKQQDDAQQTYMSGGALSKIFDLIGTTNYAAAGAAEALTNLENPIEGALQGIHTRETFGDVLEHKGLPKWAAAPLGIIADFAVPVAPGIGLLKLFGGGARIARALELGEEGMKGLTTTEDVLKNAHLGQGALPLEEVAGRELAAGQAAVEGYMSAPKGMEVLAARESAAATRAPEGAAQAAKRALAKAAEQGPTRASEAMPWLKGLQAFGETLIRKSRSTFLDQSFFGADVGKDFVAGLEQQKELSRRLKGALLPRVNEIARLVGKNTEEFMHVANGSGPIRSEGVRQAMELYGPLRKELFDVPHALGVHQTDELATIVYRRLKLDQRQEVQRLLASPNAADLEKAASTEEGRFATYLKGRGGSISAGETIVKPLTAVADYIPLVPKKLDKKTLGIQAHAEVKALIMRFNPNMPEELAGLAAEQTLASRRLGSMDISKMLQHQRSGWGGFNPDIHVSDTKAVLYKMVNDASDLIAGAKVWGGRLEKYGGPEKSIRSRFLELNGMSRYASDARANPDAARALSNMDKLFDITQGVYRDPHNELTKLVSRVSDVLFLSPRTILLQPTTMANSIAMSGMSNSFMSVGEFFTNPTFRKMGERLGVFLPNVWHGLDEKEGLKVIDRMNIVMHGIGSADVAMRAQATMAGALHAVEMEEKMTRALKAGNRMRAEKLAQTLERRFGVSAEQILQRGGEITPEEMFRVAAQTAHQTNFTSDALQLPMAFSTPAGKFFLKFKQFSVQQGHFINGLLNEAAVHGNWGPILRYASMFPWVYSHVQKAAQQLKPDDLSVHEDTKAYLQNLLMIGAMGYWGDAAMALGSKSEALQLGVITGANTAALLKIFKAGVKTISPFDNDLPGAWEELKPATVRQGEALWGRISNQ